MPVERIVTDEANSESWSRQTLTYDDQGRLMQRAVAMDDGSSHVTRTDRGDTHDWRTLGVSYDATGARTGLTFRKDGNEWETSIRYDAAGSEDWSKITVSKEGPSFHGMARYEVRAVDYDDGSRTVTRSDLLDAEDWRSTTTTYDAAGTRISAETVQDDGSRVVNHYDAAGAEVWDKQSLSFDALGRLTLKATDFDDGGRSVARFDAAGTEAWTQVVTKYDASGRVARQITEEDSGKATEILRDAAGTEAWSKLTVASADGAVTQRSLDFDLGGKAVVQYDAADAASWTAQGRFYMADGNLAYAFRLDDDVAKPVENYGKAAWTHVTATHRAADLGNGVTLILDYDRDDTADWRVYAKLTDAAGERFYGASIMDDGSLRELFPAPLDWLI